MVQDGWSIGHVVSYILRGIFYKINVLGLRLIVQVRCRLFRMLGRELHVSMHHWIIGNKIIMHLTLIWSVTFFIRLFLF